MKLYVLRCRSNQEAHTAAAFYDEAQAQERAAKADAGPNCPNTDHHVDVFVPVEAIRTAVRALDLPGGHNPGMRHGYLTARKHALEAVAQVTDRP